MSDNVGDWSRFEEIAQKWEEMRKRLGDYGMAELVTKTKSWREYDNKWPFDMMATWQNNLDITDPALQIQSNQASIEEEVADRLDTERLIAELSPRAKKVFEALRDGATSVQIEYEQGYNTNNAVRWHKHQIKKKYIEIKNEQYKLCFEFVCRDCGLVFDGQEVDSICPSCDSGDTLFIKSYTKPI